MSTLVAKHLYNAVFAYLYDVFHKIQKYIYNNIITTMCGTNVHVVYCIVVENFELFCFHVFLAETLFHLSALRFFFVKLALPAVNIDMIATFSILFLPFFCYAILNATNNIHLECTFKLISFT